MVAVARGAICHEFFGFSGTRLGADTHQRARPLFVPFSPAPCLQRFGGAVSDDASDIAR
jgi:hypothetical protein